jgi:hypothetical protein
LLLELLVPLKCCYDQLSYKVSRELWGLGESGVAVVRHLLLLLLKAPEGCQQHFNLLHPECQELFALQLLQLLHCSRYNQQPAAAAGAGTAAAVGHSWQVCE